MHGSKTSLHIIHLGISGFPNGFGAMQRLILLYKGLLAADVKPLVINRKGRYSPAQYPNLEVEGVHEGIPYQYLTSSPYRPSGFLQRNMHKMGGFLKEWQLLRQKKRAGELDAALVYILGEMHYLVYYYLISRIIGFPIILNYVELNSSFDNRNLRQRVNDWLFDRWAPKLADGLLPISDFLKAHIERYAPNARQLKIPVITDLDAYTPATPAAPLHLLYCGAASYRPLIQFVLEAFALTEREDVQIKFILGGSEQDLQWVRQQISNSPARERIELLENMPHREVPRHLAAAAGLLIPIRPTIQDAARFPHKLGEYLASGTPLVTTAHGEIPNYLENGKHAYIAEAYDPAMYARKIEALLADPALAKQIGCAGRQLAKEAFDYVSHGYKIKTFIEEIIDSKSNSRS